MGFDLLSIALGGPRGLVGLERFGGGLGCVGLTKKEGFLRTLGVWGLAWGLGGLDQLRGVWGGLLAFRRVG